MDNEEKETENKIREAMYGMIAQYCKDVDQQFDEGVAKLAIHLNIKLLMDKLKK